MEFRIHFISNRISKKLNGGDVARDERYGASKSRNIIRSRRGVLFEMTLREVVNPRIDSRDMNGRAGAGPPNPGVQAAEVGGRRQRRHSLR